MDGGREASGAAGLGSGAESSSIWAASVEADSSHDAEWPEDADDPSMHDECGICLEAHVACDCVRFAQCSHTFCRECLLGCLGPAGRAAARPGQPAERATPNPCPTNRSPDGAKATQVTLQGGRAAAAAARSGTSLCLISSDGKETALVAGKAA